MAITVLEDFQPPHHNDTSVSIQIHLLAGMIEKVLAWEGWNKSFFLYREAHEQCSSYHLQSSPSPYHQ